MERCLNQNPEYDGRIAVDLTDAASRPTQKSDGDGRRVFPPLRGQPRTRLAIANMLTAIGLCEELFHTLSGTAFADIIVAGRRENLAHPQQAVLGAPATLPLFGDRGVGERRRIRSALDLLEARALFDGPERTVHIRTAKYDGHICLDLPISTGAPSTSGPMAGG
jgi:hypothetical protein